MNISTLKLRLLGRMRRVFPDYLDVRRLYGAHVDIHPSSIILPSFRLDLRHPEPHRVYFKAGADCILGGTFVFESSSGLVTLGDRVFFGSSTAICRSQIRLGSDIFVAWSSYLYDHNSHSLDYKERQKDMARHLSDIRTGKGSPVFSKDWSQVAAQPIVVGDNSWIGLGCIILKGVTIGTGAIVGAGSVVVRNVESWTVVGGNPASTLKILPPELRDPGDAGEAHGS